jgi:hypothetical protein
MIAKDKTFLSNLLSELIRMTRNKSGPLISQAYVSKREYTGSLMHAKQLIITSPLKINELCFL